MRKIIYFDEGSVTDFIQINNNGDLKKTTELLKDTNRVISGEGKAETKINPLAGLLSALTGFNSSLEVNVNGSMKSDTNRLAKTIINNTVLTDFINLFGENSKDKSIGIEKFQNVSLSEPKGSLTEMLRLSTYANMMEGAHSIDNQPNMEIKFNKMYETIKLAKGYFEYIGNIDSLSKGIFRFNIEAFRNNYRGNDLSKMNLTLFAIEVGRIKDEDLDMNSEFNVSSNLNEFPEEMVISEVKNYESSEMRLFDVLLAGVE